MIFSVFFSLGGRRFCANSQGTRHKFLLEKSGKEAAARPVPRRFYLVLIVSIDYSDLNHAFSFSDVFFLPIEDFAVAEDVGARAPSRIAGNVQVC